MNITSTVREKMMKEDILFAYRGVISEKNSLALLTLLETEMKEDSYGFTGRKRLFMYVLESLQNIVKHGERTDYGRMSLVSFTKTKDGYKITTGNIVSAEHLDDLRSKLEKITSLDPEGTRALYRQILSNSGFSQKGGAGLGLIEMALKTGNRLDYDFIRVDGKHHYFLLSKTVGAEGVGVEKGDPAEVFGSDSSVQLERMMAGNKIYMIWSGHVTPGIGEEVLSITEVKLAEEDIDTALRRRIFNILIEMLENVSKYNPGKEAEQNFGKPMAMIRLENGRFVLTTGNLIHNSEIDDLKDKLEKINSLDQVSLKSLFYSSLSSQTIDTDSTGNMGLISMARKAGNRLDYKFDTINEVYSYFILTVMVGNNQNYSEGF